MSRRFSALDLAARLGFSAAAVYDRIGTLCRLQKRKNQAYYYDGHPWIPLPPEDYPRIFPYMPASAVVKALGDLKNEGLVKEIHRGHVSWYTLI